MLDLLTQKRERTIFDLLFVLVSSTCKFFNFSVEMKGIFEMHLVVQKKYYTCVDEKSCFSENPEKQYFISKKGFFYMGLFFYRCIFLIQFLSK